MTNPIDTFIEKFCALDEIDYGDFMRKANHYLIELQLKCAVDYALDIIHQMHLAIQYQPNWDIPTTKKQIFELALHIKGLHQDPFNISNKASPNLSILDSPTP
jgi:hypothetical protein